MSKTSPLSRTVAYRNDPLGLNIGAHKEAAEHFLSALSMQDVTGEQLSSDNTSKQLWSTLRRTFFTMVSDPWSDSLNSPDLAGGAKRPGGPC